MILQYFFRIHEEVFLLIYTQNIHTYTYIQLQYVCIHRSIYIYLNSVYYKKLQSIIICTSMHSCIWQRTSVHRLQLQYTNSSIKMYSSHNLAKSNFTHNLYSFLKQWKFFHTWNNSEKQITNLSRYATFSSLRTGCYKTQMYTLGNIYYFIHTLLKSSCTSTFKVHFEQSRQFRPEKQYSHTEN